MGERKVHPARKAFDSAERAVGKPLERVVNAPSGASALMTLAKLSRFGFGQVRAVRSTIVHLAALPTDRDVAKLTAQIGRLEARLDELAQRLDESGALAAPPSAGTDGRSDS